MGGKSNSETLSPEIRKIELKNLENFIQSEIFRQFSIVPITPSRAKSYLSNPHGLPSDVVLILALVDGDLVAFRSIFAGVVQSGSETIRFGWCSGAWVKPGFRRKGLSKQLLEEALADWEGKLMFSNYAPEAEKLILSTGRFKPIHQFDGARAYLFPKTVKLLPFAQKNKLVKMAFLLIDIFIAGFAKIRSSFFSLKKNPEIRFEEMEFPDAPCFQFLQNKNATCLFGRDKKEWEWIFRFPWMSETNRELKNKYPFSACSDSFFYRTVKVLQKNELKGVFIFSVREGHLKTLYSNLTSPLENETALFIKKYCVKHQIELVTVYNTPIARQFFAQKFPFLHIKRMGQKIYSSFDIQGTEKFQIQDGDGDSVFT